MKRTACILLAAMALVSLPTASAAQLQLAPELAVADDVDFGLGGRILVGLPLANSNMQGAGFFTVFFPGNDFNYWELGGTLYYRFALAQNPTIVPKAGAGVTIGRSSVSDVSNTEVGMQLVGAIEFLTGRITPYGEFQIGIGDIPDFALRGGVAFTLGTGGG